MELKIIEQLLEKYFDAATSIAEENMLKAYFSSPNVAPHLEQYRPMFGYFAKESNRKFEKTIPLKTRKRYTAWVSVAASVVLLAGMFTYLNNGIQSSAGESLGTYNDPEVAFKETQKALNMLSKNVNVGVNSVDYIGEYEKTRKTIFKE